MVPGATVNRRYAWIAAQAVVTIVLLAALLRGLNLDAFRTSFVRLPVWFYLFSLAVVLAGQVAYAWRWKLLLVGAGVRAPFTLIIRQYFIGIFLNKFFPSTVGGDVGKVYLLGRDHGYGVPPRPRPRPPTARQPRPAATGQHWPTAPGTGGRARRAVRPWNVSPQG